MQSNLSSIVGLKGTLPSLLSDTKQAKSELKQYPLDMYGSIPSRGLRGSIYSNAKRGIDPKYDSPYKVKQGIMHNKSHSVQMNQYSLYIYSLCRKRKGYTDSALAQYEDRFVVRDLNSNKVNANFDPIIDGARFKPNSILLEEPEGEDKIIHGKKKQTTIDTMLTNLNVAISPSKRKMIRDHYDLVYREPSPKNYLRSFYIGMRSVGAMALP